MRSPSEATANTPDGYTRRERLSRETYNMGHSPEAVPADKLFRNRENLQYCAAHGMRLSVPRLGRPAKMAFICPHSSPDFHRGNAPIQQAL